MSDTRRRRTVFDEDAALYDAARPGYPEELFDDLIALSGLPPGGRVLEIGCGTGQATLPLARRGYRITCVELGSHLAAVARAKLAPYPAVEVVNAAFEDYAVEPEAYDIVTSATAFHWVAPDLRYRKAAGALPPGRALAPFWNEHVRTERDGGFPEAVQEAYRDAAPDMAANYAPMPWPDELPDDEAGRIERSGLFGPVAVRRHPWETEYDAETYVRLLDTYSNHRAWPPEVRARLYERMRTLIETRYGGRITKAYLATLYVARRT